MKKLSLTASVLIFLLGFFSFGNIENAEAKATDTSKWPVTGERPNPVGSSGEFKFQYISFTCPQGHKIFHVEYDAPRGMELPEGYEKKIYADNMLSVLNFKEITLPNENGFFNCIYEYGVDDNRILIEARYNLDEDAGVVINYDSCKKVEDNKIVCSTH